MQELNRVDLADIHDPKLLACALHKLIGRLDRAIPAGEISLALGVSEVRIETLEGCEGVLLTDRRRSWGKILVNDARGAQAARFGIAHELGHFLLEQHELGLDGRFTCNLEDMHRTRTARKNQEQEAEANEFSIAFLAPEYLTAPFLAAQPDIAAVRDMSKALDLSLEATMRCFVDRHDEPLAAIWTENGVIRNMMRRPIFPWIAREFGQAVSSLSLTSTAFSKGDQGTSKMSEVPASAWTKADVPELFEQVRIGRDGHSLTLLWATLPEGSGD